MQKDKNKSASAGIEPGSTAWKAAHHYTTDAWIDYYTDNFA